MGFQPKYQTRAVGKVPTSLIEIQATSLSVELWQIQFITQYVSEPKSDMHFNKSNITYTNVEDSKSRYGPQDWKSICVNNQYVYSIPHV